MNKRDFSFDLPEDLIAQTPIARREQSRLLRLDRLTGDTDHRRFYELPDILRKGDCLVLNDSRVLPARLIGKRATGGAVEVLLLREVRDHATTWECMTRPGRKTKIGTELVFGDGELTAAVIGETEGGNRLIRFEYGESPLSESSRGSFPTVVERLGKMPLPPYIHEELKDSERYQTVYSKTSGSAAAPTAGLHFTNELLDTIMNCGVEICYVTLHVGLGTFRPVKSDSIEDHKMHAEYFIIPEETVISVNRTKKNGGRVIAVGTTSCRALESCADMTGMVSIYSGFTDIFIYPGYGFKCIDGLITNFHLPESTLIMLVSALAGRENVMRAYDEAIRERYRFYSLGDAMLIL